MSDAIFTEIRECAEQAAVRVCWTQWVALGSLASPVGQAQARSIVDPEALILLSLTIQERERRLLDMVAWWAHTGAGLTSVQRLRSVAGRFPTAAGASGLEEFASLATRSGDRRWAKLARPSSTEAPRGLKGPDQLDLIEASALWPRLRAGFGVGAKADVLVFLLGLRGAWASTKMIAFATGYTTVTSARAASEMAQARLIRETSNRPVEFSAPPGPWAELLELYPTPSSWDAPAEPQAPAWRFWAEIFAFLAASIEWARLQGQVGDRVLASRARDLIERHMQAFHYNGIEVPPLDAFRGSDAIRAFREVVMAVAEWTADTV